MLNFESDYIEGAHPKILEKLVDTNYVQVSGYGVDQYSQSAKEKIKEAIQCPEAAITFLAGGTQANQIVIDSILDTYEGVVSAVSGHIATHEAGAIELCGHKVLTIPEHQGKMDPQELEAFLKKFYGDGNHEHMVFPGMVYITHPTEYGTLYTKEELTAISKICHSYNLPLYLDGARMGYGLMAYNTDVDLPLIAKCTDVFYIGGTKVGALIGEAVIFTSGNEPKHFITRVKQHGGLLAKGRLIGIQFDALFTDGLYFRIAKHAIDLAMYLKEELVKKGYQLLLDSPTNQQFLILEDAVMEELKKEVSFSFWEKYDENHTVIRLATSWATKKENVDRLLALL